nr:MAG TPA: hypothetical protein [Caudoviricetes sp.]
MCLNKYFAVYRNIIIKLLILEKCITKKYYEGQD